MPFSIKLKSAYMADGEKTVDVSISHTSQGGEHVRTIIFSDKADLKTKIEASIQELKDDFQDKQAAIDEAQEAITELNDAQTAAEKP